MNILIAVIDNGVGGIQTRILSIIKKIDDENFNFLFTVPKRPGPFSNEVKNNGFKVYPSYIQSPKFFDSIYNILHNIIWALLFPVAVIQICMIIKRERVDIVHVNGLLALQPVLAAKLMKKKIIWHLIGTLYPKPLLRLIQPLYVKWADKIVFISEKTADYYLMDIDIKNKTEIIYEPVDVTFFNIEKISMTIQNKIKQKYGLSNNFLIVGTVCDISPIKGLEYFIEIASHLKKNENLKFFIVGGTGRGHEQYVNNLKNLIESLKLNNQIIFTGNIEHCLIREMVSIMDIFIVTSTSEGTPISILEAMAMSKPVIASNVGGISEQIVDGNTGFLVNAKDVEIFVKHIKCLLENPYEIKQLGNNGRRRVEQMFSLETCVKRHLELYEKIGLKK